MADSENDTEGEETSLQRSLPRREWFTAFAAGGVVAATAALGYESCEVAPRPSDSPDLELRYIKDAVDPLRTTDYVAEGKRQGIFSDDIQGTLATDVNEYLSTTYQALVYSELVNALPEDLQKSEEVQSNIAAMSPVLDQAVADAYYVVGMADDVTMAQIDREVKDDPDVLMDMASLLDRDGAKQGMGLRGRLRLRRASRQLSSRLRMQSAKEVVADLTDQMTRYAERNASRTASDTSFEVSLATRRMWAAYQEPVGGVERSQPGQDEDSLNPASEVPLVESEPSEEAASDADLKRLQRIARLEAKEKSLTRASRGLA
ncbi:MAG: hypothetical protein WBN70_14940, partial [Polyangiales bacterium]